MLPVGLEPTCLAATDFKSVVYTYSTKGANSFIYAPSSISSSNSCSKACTFSSASSIIFTKILSARSGLVYSTQRSLHRRSINSSSSVILLHPYMVEFGWKVLTGIIGGPKQCAWVVEHFNTSFGSIAHMHIWNAE